MKGLGSQEIVKELEEILGEALGSCQARGEGDLPLARRAREALDRLKASTDRPAGAREASERPGGEEPEATTAAQRAALERIAGGVRPSGWGDRGLAMLTLREARAVAQNALRLSEGRTSGRQRSIGEAALRDAERLRARALSGDLRGAEREARLILERDEAPDAGGQEATLSVFARTLLELLEGRVGLDVRRAATSGRVRAEREAREAAERRGERAELEAAELRRTLAWYAQEANHRPTLTTGGGEGPSSAAERDGGRKAREALGKAEAGRGAARRLGAAEGFVQRVRAELEGYERGLAGHDPPSGDGR